MDHDTAAEHSAREARGAGSSSSPAEDHNDDGTSRPDQQALRESHDMNQAAPAATVPPALPSHELPGTAVGTLPPQGSEVALQASTDSGGEAPTELKATSLESLILLSAEETGCDSGGSDGDRSQSEATTGSVSPAPAACFSSYATPAGGGPPSPPASVAEAAAAKEAQSRMFHTGPPDGTAAVTLTASSTSSVTSFQQQEGHHHPPAEPVNSLSLAASAAVLPGGPAAGAASAAAEEGEKNARIMSSPSAAKLPSSSSTGATAERRDNSLPPSPPSEHEDQNHGQQEAAPAASAATTIKTLEEGGDDTNIHADDAQQQHRPLQREGGVLIGGAQDDRPISDNPALTLSASSPSYESHHRLVQHTRRNVYEPHQPPAVLHPGGAATDLVAAAATTSTHLQFHAGGLQQPAFGNYNAHAQPPPAAAAAYYGHHPPTQYSAGGPTPPPPPGTVLGGAGLPYHSYQSGFVLPFTGRAPLLSAPPPGGGIDRYDLVPLGAAYDPHHGHQRVCQPKHALHSRQQQFESGSPDALAPAEHPRPDATAGAPQTLTEGVLTMPQSSSGGAASGGVRGGAPAPAPAPALGTAAGVMAAAAAAAGGRADGDAVQNNAYNDIGLVVTRTKELEKIMRDSFHATGNGLNELLSSLRTDRRIDPRTQQRIRSIAAMRNKLVHSVDANNLTMSNTFGASARKAFKVMCDDLELSLRECAAKVIEEPFEQAARPADAFRLGNHPAFRGIGGGGGGGAGEDGDYDEAAGMAEAEAAEVARREQEALIVKDNARFPHNLITAKRKNRRTEGSAAPPAPDVNDEGAFPDINFASSAAVQQQSRRAARGEGAAGGGGGQVPPGPSQGGGR
ncbi:unnamed protein product, partial [Ectocarpus sp. 13 AM-2016]